MPDADVTEETTEETPTEQAETPTETEQTPDAEPDTFDRPYVEKIRKESAGYRDRAKTAEARVDELAHALFSARVAATGKLADPTDLAFDAEALDDAAKLATAIDALLESKPHLQARRPTGSVGQGIKGDTAPVFSLLDRLKGKV
ncbi:hypothetical protein [Mycobacterium marseillense]|uniref:Scaffolding protein n=1 Tax=Mycobacterium marseillense TaxID=701042 RepID=A0AAC9VWS9_9MYCO|nr:hypothetical protein [Mycobacterium marseillense]ASW91273.1 hypothetical protein CKJ54_16375 [Mycobacterium marseillense]